MRCVYCTACIVTAVTESHSIEILRIKENNESKSTVLYSWKLIPVPFTSLTHDKLNFQELDNSSLMQQIIFRKSMFSFLCKRRISHLKFYVRMQIHSET